MNIASNPCPKPISWEEHFKSWLAYEPLLPAARSYCSSARLLQTEVYFTQHSPDKI